MANKEYGLIIPSKKKASFKPQSRALNPLINSDDELERDEDKDEETFNWVESALKKTAGNSGQKALQKRLLREAYEEDSTVFQYDEVYDGMKATQQEELEKKRQLQQRKPKYIETILKHSEKRKLENERRLERKVQKERDEEGNKFADKESFVTPSYLKKLEELKRAEQEEQLEKLIEEKQDLHKHKNFGVFYNHLFKQRIREVEIKEEPLDPDVETESTFTSSRQKKHYRTQEDLSDEEPSQKLKDVSKIKKEIESSCSSGDERTRNLDEKKYLSRKKSYKNGSEREGIEDRRKSRSNRERNFSRSKSRDKERRHYDKNNDRRSRNNGDKSKEKSTRDKSTGRNNRDALRERNYRYTSVEKEMNKSHKRNTRDRSRDRNGRDRRADHKKRSRSREQLRKEDRSKKIKEEDGSEKETGKENSDTEKDAEKTETKHKQSINKRLGATDVNKMKLEDRIKRFNEIFAKRTVGKTYEDAVQRYFQRKAERESNGLM